VKHEYTFYVRVTVVEVIEQKRAIRRTITAT
jgi:hypothetical protein